MITIYTDGASRGNPGKSALGAVAFNEDKEKIFELSEYLGISTNNFAEYSAVIYALKKALELGLSGEDIRILADSKLMVEQASGNWKVKHPNIKSLHTELMNLSSLFKSVTFKHIPRELNEEADALANVALDSAI